MLEKFTSWWYGEEKKAKDTFRESMTQLAMTAGFTVIFEPILRRRQMLYDNLPFKWTTSKPGMKDFMVTLKKSVNFEGNASEESCNIEMYEASQSEIDLNDITSNKWTQICEAGAGGFGAVYMYKSGSGKIMALKTFHDDDLWQREKKVLTFIHKEVRGKLPETIVGPITYDESNKQMMMPFLPYDLYEFIKTRPLTNDEAGIVLRDMSNAIGFLHTRGLRNNDIKPDNIMVRRFDDGKIVSVAMIDLGLVSTIKKQNNNSGSPGYMSYEVLLSLKNNNEYLYTKDSSEGARCDLFALGATLYECMTSTPWYTKEGTDLLEIRSDSRDHYSKLLQTCNGDDQLAEWSEFAKFRSLEKGEETQLQSGETQFVNTVDKDLSDIIMGLLQPSIARRIKTVKELLAMKTRSSPKTSPAKSRAKSPPKTSPAKSPRSPPKTSPAKST